MNHHIKKFYLHFGLAVIICMAATGRSAGASQGLLQPAAFPQTINNVSFQDRTSNKFAGYAPFKDAKAYNGLDIETQEKAWNRRIAMMEQQRLKDELTMSDKEYCEKYLDQEKCNQTQADVDAVIADGYAHSNTSEESQTTATANSNNGETSQATQTAAMAYEIISQNNNSQSGSATTTNTNSTASNNRAQQHDQCTPPDLYVEQGFTEALTRTYTTGRYFKTEPPFGKSTLAIMQSEGMKCAQDPSNNGSLTCYGFMQSANPDIDVRDLNLTSAEDRTYKRYYNDLGIYKLPDNISGDVLHVAFWRGPAKAIPTLCTVLGTSCQKKGSISDDIVKLAENYNGDLHNDYWDQTWTELRQKNPKRLWKAFQKRVSHARNNGCYVQPKHPVKI